MENATVIPRLPLAEGEMFFPSPLVVMPARPGTPGSVRLTSSVTLTSRLPHDLTRLSATSLITLQLAERVPLRTFYDGLFRFPCHYGIQLYRKAAEIFDRLHDYQPGSKCNLLVENIEFSCNEEKKLAFELAYAAMKCKLYRPWVMLHVKCHEFHVQRRTDRISGPYFSPQMRKFSARL